MIPANPPNESPAPEHRDPNGETVDVTDEQWDLFCSTVRLWWNWLGLDRAGVELSIARDALDCQGKCCANTTFRQITIYQSTRLQRIDATDERIRQTALHEVCHAFLFPITWLAWDRLVTDEQLNAADHEVTHRLARLLERAFEHHS